MTKRQRYIDVHLHLQDKQLSGNLDGVITRAEQACVEFMLCNSGGEHDWHKVLALGEKYQSVVPLIGVHPWFVEDQCDNWDKRLFELAQTHSCGIGETGLDRLLTKSDFQLQSQVFIKQLTIAKELDRPITIHCLSSYGHLLKILKEFSPLPEGSFLHSYSGSAEMITEFAKLGVMFSYNAKACDQRSSRYRQSIKATPLESILLETDSPFMAPACIEPPNVPSNLPLFAEEIAKIKNIPLETLCEAAYSNAQRIIEQIRSTSRSNASRIADNEA